jgi:hypothetical protein
MSYCVFVLKHGQWAQHATYRSRANATQELAYLVAMLGLQAKICVRIR